MGSPLQPGGQPPLWKDATTSAAILDCCRRRGRTTRSSDMTACRDHDNLSALCLSPCSSRPGRLDCLLSRSGVIIGAETMTLRPRLVLLLMLPLLLVIGAYSVLRVQQESRARVEDEQARAESMVRTIQIAVESALAVRGRPQAELVDLLNDLTAGQKAIDGIRLFNRDGHVVAVSTAQASAHPAAGSEVVTRVIETGRGELVETHGRAGNWWVYVLPVHYATTEGRISSAATRHALEIAFVAPDTQKMARQAIRDVLVRVGSLTLALLIAFVLQREILHPLASLAHSIRALGEGRRGPPLPVRRHDELGEVAEAFNRMTEQLEE